MTAIDNRLGKTLRYYRQQRGWTVAEAARRVGIGRQYLSAIELGRKTPELLTAAQICAALGLSTTQTRKLLMTLRQSHIDRHALHSYRDFRYAQCCFETHRDTKLEIPKSYVEN